MSSDGPPAASTTTTTAAAAAATPSDAAPATAAAAPPAAAGAAAGGGAAAGATTPDPKAVFVTNISSEATKKTVASFFSFCGKIVSLALQPTAGATGGEQEAVVKFDTESAAKTALLLTNAMIVDKAIAVTPYCVATHDEPPPSAQMAADALPQKDYAGVPDEQRTKTSVVASMLAAGYTLGEGALGKAKEYDDKHMVTLSVNVGVEQMRAKLNEVDEKLGVSAAVGSATKAISDQVKAIDEQYKVSEKVTNAATAVTDTVNAAAATASAKVMENETIAGGVAKVQETTGAAVKSVEGAVTGLKSETAAEIEKRHAQQAADAAAAPAAAKGADAAADAADAPAAAAAPAAPAATPDAAPAADAAAAATGGADAKQQ